MNKTILLILFTVTHFFSKAQQAVVALPAMNVIYIGLDNPINIAVEGYTNNQLTVTTEGCAIEGTYPETYLTATTTSLSGCQIFVSYQKDKKIKIDTLNFRIKSIPKPESMFGTLESGSCPAAAMLAQNTIRAVMHNFVFQGVTFKVTSYQWMFISNDGLTECSDTVKSAVISNKLEELISKSVGGDKILIDDIKAIGPGGIQKRLSPIALSVQGKKKETLKPDFLTYQKDGEDKISYLPFQAIYGCNQEPLFPPGVLKLFNVHANDTILIKEIFINKNYEIHSNANKTLYERDNYPSGKIKVEYNFEGSDTIGTATLYYENGKIKSQGKIIPRTLNISESLQWWRFFDEADTLSSFLEKFINNDYAPIGNWKGYYEDGSIALDCNFKLEGYADLEYEIDTTIFIRCGNYEAKFYSISEAMKHPKNRFYPELSGICKTFNQQGKLISEETFKD